MIAAGKYYLPQELARNAPECGPFQPGELREACRWAGEGLGRQDASRGEFRVAAEMVPLWRELDLLAWEAPYVLRAARLEHLSGFGEVLICGSLDTETASRAATARRCERWPERLHAPRDTDCGG